MALMFLVFIALAFLAGCLVPIQVGINAQLGAHAGHPLLATLTSMSVGALASLFILKLLGVSFPSFQVVQNAPYWMYLGGCIGVFAVTTALFLAPKLGAGTLLAFLVAGQLFGSVVVDHLGAFGFPHQPLSSLRVLGCFLLMSGVLLIQNKP